MSPTSASSAAPANVVATAFGALHIGAPRPLQHSSENLALVLTRARQRGRELAPGADAELAVRVGEVHLYGLRRHVEHLRDVAVREAVGGQVGDPPLARRQ